MTAGRSPARATPRPPSPTGSTGSPSAARPPAPSPTPPAARSPPTTGNGVAYAYAYDNSDRLTGVTVGGAATAAYGHNALGQRVSKDAGGVVTHFHYDRAGRLIAETSPDGLGGFTLVKEYVDVDGLPLAVIEPGSGSGIAAETPLDNDGAGTAGTGLWTAETAQPGHLGADYRMRRGGDGTESYSWTPAVPAADRYQVYARWPELGPDEGSTATYTVTHAGGATPVTVDQRVKGGDWNLLGAFELTPGQNHGVALSDLVDAAPLPPDPNAGGGAETIIDNFDPSTTRIGGWTVSGSDLEYASVRSGSARFQWPTPASAGYYAVYSQWTDYPAGVGDAPYTIHHGGGTTIVPANQTANFRPTVPWNPIGGVFHLDPSAGHMVELSNDSVWNCFCYVKADGVRYVRQPDPPAGAVIIDNSDLGASAVGVWPVGNWMGDTFWGSDFAFHAPGTGTDTFTWAPAIPAPGRYHVYARWRTHTLRATDAPYTIHHRYGATEVRVNQQADGGRWNLLGSFEMTPGANHRVVLSDDANEHVIADAVMLVPDTTSRVVAADAIRLVANNAEDPLFVHADHLGTPRRMTDTAQSIVWDHVTRPFGETVSLLGVFENNRRFPGQYFDSETALHYNYFRDYDPALGRYVQSDPIGLDGGLNTFAYVGGNPVNNVDLRGQQTLDDRLNCLASPRRCGRVLDCADKAEQETLAKFNRQGHNDISDAFRHCYLSCCMTRRIGARNAQTWGDGHENWSGNPVCEKAMDLYNNFAGRTVASANPSGDCKVLCSNTVLAVAEEPDFCPTSGGCKMNYQVPTP